jgi:hypothetical protein
VSHDHQLWWIGCIAAVHLKVLTHGLFPHPFSFSLPPLSLSLFPHPLPRRAHHPIRGQLVKTFFQGGSIEGPFPGARSAYGDWAAGAFYELCRPEEGKMSTLLHSTKFAPGGNRLLNHNQMP